MLPGSMLPSDVRLIVPLVVPVTLFSRLNVAPEFFAVSVTALADIVPDVVTDEALSALTRKVPAPLLAEPVKETVPDAASEI